MQLTQLESDITVTYVPCFIFGIALTTTENGSIATCVLDNIQGPTYAINKQLESDRIVTSVPYNIYRGQPSLGPAP